MRIRLTCDRQHKPKGRYETIMDTTVDYYGPKDKGGHGMIAACPVCPNNVPPLDKLLKREVLPPAPTPEEEREQPELRFCQQHTTKHEICVIDSSESHIIVPVIWNPSLKGNPADRLQGRTRGH